jgi:hypothetical protein
MTDDTGLPDKVWISRGEILRSRLGVTDTGLRAAVSSGTLQRHTLPGTTGRKQKFLRTDVVRVLGGPHGKA